MEGLEAIVLPLSEVLRDNETKRFDPEYFDKKAVSAYQRLASEARLGDFVQNGYRVVYENTKIVARDTGIELGLPFFLQSADISTPFINEERMSCVPESDWIRYQKGHIRRGELLVEVKGRAEKVAIVPGNFPERTLVTGTCFKIETTEPKYRSLLLAHLIGKYGKALKNRLKTNLLVSYIAKNDLYRLPVPNLGEGTCDAIHSVVEASLSHRAEIVGTHRPHHSARPITPLLLGRTHHMKPVTDSPRHR